MTWEQTQAAIEEAKSTLYQADRIVRQLGGHVIERLHLLDNTQLKQLKRKLRNYDSNRRRWKTKP